MKCKQCNNEIDDESSFCKHCGKKVEIEDKIEDLTQEFRDMRKQLRENFIIDGLFYEENTAVLKKFRKFAKEKIKFFEKLKKQGKYEEFMEKCEKRLYKKEDKPKKKRKV